MTTTKIPTITLLATENPKREGTASHKRFSLYENGMSVSAYVEKANKIKGKHGKPGKHGAADIKWDLKRGYIKVTDQPAPAE